jgi:hypothetical protein
MKNRLNEDKTPIPGDVYHIIIPTWEVPLVEIHWTYWLVVEVESDGCARCLPFDNQPLLERHDIEVPFEYKGRKDAYTVRRHPFLQDIWVFHSTLLATAHLGRISPPDLARVLRMEYRAEDNDPEDQGDEGDPELEEHLDALHREIERMDEYHRKHSPQVLDLSLDN